MDKASTPGKMRIGCRRLLLSRRPSDRQIAMRPTKTPQNRVNRLDPVVKPLFHPAVADITVQGILHALSDPVRVRIFVELSAAECPKNCTAFENLGTPRFRNPRCRSNSRSFAMRGSFGASGRASNCTTEHDAQRSRINSAR